MVWDDFSRFCSEKGGLGLSNRKAGRKESRSGGKDLGGWYWLSVLSVL